MVRTAGLFSANGTRIALKSVHVEGRLDGILATMAVAQRYRNDSGERLEIVYTFPLAYGAVPLGMAATVGSKRLDAVVMGRDEAWERYETAVDSGDTPVLVEQSAPDLCTVNLGNIENGDDVTVEIRYAQVLQFEHGSLRLAIPFAIAPRYGDPHRDGDLSPHESIDADLQADYPLTVRILLCGNLAGAAVECPSHPCDMKSTADGTVVELNPGARLDRDYILTISGLEQRSFPLSGPDIEGRSLVLAGFRPALPATAAKPLRLKILADCSGSMAGDGNRSVKEALTGLLRMLEPGDRISYSRFGDTVRHETAGFLPCSGDTVKRLAKAFAQTKADMGGTDIEQAALSTLNDIRLPEDGHDAPCVLLITGGHSWVTANIVHAARASGQRLFVIGVGSAPAAAPLGRLALETGGACAFVSPNEHMTRAVKRVVDRMREVPAKPLRIDWGRDPVWQSDLPLNVYKGDFVSAFASFAGLPPDIRLAAPALSCRSGEKECRMYAGPPGMAWDDAIARLAGAARLAMAESPEEARNLALQHQIVSRHTTLFMIYEREDNKNAGLPVLHQIPQMTAAGHGGFGSALRSLRAKRGRLRITAGSGKCRFEGSVHPGTGQRKRTG